MSTNRTYKYFPVQGHVRIYQNEVGIVFEDSKGVHAFSVPLDTAQVKILEEDLQEVCGVTFEKRIEEGDEEQKAKEKNS